MRTLAGYVILMIGLVIAAEVFVSPFDRTSREPGVFAWLSGDDRVVAPVPHAAVRPATVARFAAPAAFGYRAEEAEPIAEQATAEPRWTTITHVSPSNAALPANRRDPQQLSGYALARALQAELRRVGCYVGPVDGSWGSGSRRAMSAFTRRVDARLPVDRPDQVLINLVRAHKTGSCADQIVARAQKRAIKPGIETASVNVRKIDAQRSVPPGMMSVGGPRPPASVGTLAPLVQSAALAVEADVSTAQAQEPSVKPRRAMRRSARTHGYRRARGSGSRSYASNYRRRSGGFDIRTFID